MNRLTPPGIAATARRHRARVRNQLLNRLTPPGIAATARQIPRRGSQLHPAASRPPELRRLRATPLSPGISGTLPSPFASASRLPVQADPSTSKNGLNPLRGQRVYQSERLCGEAPELARSHRSRQTGRSRRNSNERAFPMAEERWSVARGRRQLTFAGANEQAQNDSDHRHPRSQFIRQPHRFDDQAGITRRRPQ